MTLRGANRATPFEILDACPAEERGLGGGPTALERRFLAFADVLAYSSGIASAVGGALTGAVALAFGLPQPGRWAALVLASTFLVYTIDRLRDLGRDRTSSPRRTAFVERHRARLTFAAAGAAIVSAALVLTSPPRVVALCALVGGVGLLHRRLKRSVRAKIAYVAAAWSGICVGVPWLAGERLAGDALGAGFALVFVGSAVLANLIASNLRAGKTAAAAPDTARALRRARLIALGAALLAVFAPGPFAALALVPAAEAAALFGFRRSERYAHLVIDGALALGALFAIALLGGHPGGRA